MSRWVGLYQEHSSTVYVYGQLILSPWLQRDLKDHLVPTPKRLHPSLLPDLVVCNRHSPFHSSGWPYLWSQAISSFVTHSCQLITTKKQSILVCKNQWNRREIYAGQTIHTVWLIYLNSLYLSWKTKKNRMTVTHEMEEMLSFHHSKRRQPLHLPERMPDHYLFSSSFPCLTYVLIFVWEQADCRDENTSILREAGWKLTLKVLH